MALDPVSAFLVRLLVRLLKIIAPVSNGLTSLWRWVRRR